MQNLPVAAETRILKLPDHDYPGADLIRRENAAFLERRAALREILVEGVDYGQYPGWQAKSLLVPGAQKIQMRLGLWSDPVILDKWMDERGTEYGVSVKLTLFAGDQPVSTGIGYADTFEKRRRDGQGSAWTGNTVYQMAANRALKSAARTISGLSDEFTQDIEDLPAPDAPARNGQPQGRPPAQPRGANSNGNGKQAPQGLGVCEEHGAAWLSHEKGPFHWWPQGTRYVCQGGSIFHCDTGEVWQPPATETTEPETETETETCRHPNTETIPGRGMVCFDCGRAWPVSYGIPDPKAGAEAAGSSEAETQPQSSATVDSPKDTAGAGPVSSSAPTQGPTGPDATDCPHESVEDDGYCVDCFRHVGFGACEEHGAPWLKAAGGKYYHDMGPGVIHEYKVEVNDDDLPF